MADDQTATMIANLPDRTGRSLDEWFTVLQPLGLDKHTAIVAHLKQEYGVTHGFANLISHRFRARDVSEPSPGDLVDAQYAGPKVHLRPLYDQIVAHVRTFGADVEIAPKKTGVSLRRSKQFALIEPATRTRIDVGLNLRGQPATERVRATSGMCTHKVAIADATDIDDELSALLRMAYERA